MTSPPTSVHEVNQKVGKLEPPVVYFHSYTNSIFHELRSYATILH